MCRGHTLIELTVVVAILAVLAVAAAPALGPADARKVELVAAAIATALRDARDESLRTGIPHGVGMDPAGTDPLIQELAVYRVAPAAPTGFGTVLTDPLTHAPYDRLLTGARGVAGVTLDADGRGFAFSGYGPPIAHLQFDPGGTPVLYTGGVRRPLASASVIVRHGGHAATIAVDPVTGCIIVTEG